MSSGTGDLGPPERVPADLLSDIGTAVGRIDRRLRPLDIEHAEGHPLLAVQPLPQDDVHLARWRLDVVVRSGDGVAAREVGVDAVATSRQP